MVKKKTTNKKSIKVSCNNFKDIRKNTKVAVIGSGWYGFEAALALSRDHKVVMFEAGKDLAAGTSGKFASRTHPRGWHYLRSEKTRSTCKEHYPIFVSKRKKYLVENNNAIHGIIAEKDAMGNLSKTSPAEFEKICKGDKNARTFDVKKNGYLNIEAAVTTNEESIVTGSKLSEIMRGDLLKADIEFFCNCPVLNVKKESNKYVLELSKGTAEFDYVVNATGFQRFLPENFSNNPLGMKVVYQSAIGLLYEEKNPSKDPFSILLLDGANPCLMPRSDGKYYLTHANYTLLASCNSPEEASNIFKLVDDNFIKNRVRADAEADLCRYFPTFSDKFKYVGYEKGVIAKLHTDEEFRSGFSFKDPKGVVHLFPGKITNAMHVADECRSLIIGENLEQKDSYQYVKNGTIYNSLKEISLRPPSSYKGHNTCTTNPYPQLLKNTNNNVDNFANVKEDKYLHRRIYGTRSLMWDYRGRNRSGSEDCSDKLSLVRI